MEKEYAEGKNNSIFFVRNVVTNHQSGWDSVLHVGMEYIC